MCCAVRSVQCSVLSVQSSINGQWSMVNGQAVKWSNVSVVIGEPMSTRHTTHTTTRDKIVSSCSDVVILLQNICWVVCFCCQLFVVKLSHCIANCQRSQLVVRNIYIYMLYVCSCWCSVFSESWLLIDYGLPITWLMCKCVSGKWHRKKLNISTIDVSSNQQWVCRCICIQAFGICVKLFSFSISTYYVSTYHQAMSAFFVSYL